MSNKNFHAARHNKNDEFYTQLSDIEKELSHYREHFKDKIVLCNCNDGQSNFRKYFEDHFIELGLKDLIVTEEDFRSPECIELLKQSDIVCTNPPFSLFRDYVAQLVEYEKKFLIIGNINVIICKEIFPLIKDNKLWPGINAVKEFKTPTGEVQKFGNIIWYTNLSHKKHNEELILTQKYKGNENKYPKYDDYDAIEVSKVKDIPMDYDGVMGVPITFLDKYNPKQFEIMTVVRPTVKLQYYLCGRKLYVRILIRRR